MLCVSAAQDINGQRAVMCIHQLDVPGINDPGWWDVVLCVDATPEEEEIIRHGGDGRFFDCTNVRGRSGLKALLWAKNQLPDLVNQAIRLGLTANQPVTRITICGCDERRDRAFSRVLNNTGLDWRECNEYGIHHYVLWC